MTDKKNKEIFARRFHPDDILDWKKCADKKTRGNLTRWIEDTLNKAKLKLLDRTEVDSDSGS